MAKSYDPRMHTAEHILNQTMVRMFDCGRCFAMHINPKKSKCDYHFAKPLTDKEALEIESRINDVLEQSLEVTDGQLSWEEAELAFDLNRLPKEARESSDTVRIVRVGDYDACPCSGEHVANTREIGAFRLISHGFENDVLRIRYKLDGSPA